MTRSASLTRPALPWLIALGLVLVPGLLFAAKKNYWEGKPDFDPGDAKGYYIWADGDGWHVRWTTKGRRHVFGGTISCDGAIVNFQPVSKEKKDFIKKTSAGTIRFDATASGGRDGVDFRLSPSTRTVTFDLRIDGEKAPVELVKIGGGKRRPQSVPFTISRSG